MSGHHVIASIVTLTAASSYINHKLFRLPQAIGLTLITLFLSILVLGAASFGMHFAESIKQMVIGFEFNDAFLHGMLGFLLFAVSMHVDFQELNKQKWLVLLLATLSVLISTGIIGTAFWVITKIVGLPISLGFCFLFGALISPTDPIAVLTLLKRFKVPKHLEANFAGEALFNDAMAIVLFVVILGFTVEEGSAWSTTHILTYFFQQGMGGIVFGVLLGSLAVYLLRGIDTYELAILITLAIVSGGYALADSVLNVSGVITMAVSGLMVGGGCHHYKRCQKTIDRLDSFWMLVDDLLNAILFVIIGLEFIQLSFIGVGLGLCLSVLAVVIGARWISVYVPMKVVAWKCTPSLGIVNLMTWGGIRGGIAIALALTIPDSFERNIIVSLTYFVVIFSIVVQGLTLEHLVKKIVDFRMSWCETIRKNKQ